MKGEINKLKKVCDRHVDDPQQSISALQKENIKLQEENAKLIFEKRNLTLDLKQNKINLTKSEIKYKEMKMKCAEKIRALEDEIINIKKSRPTVGELMSNIGRGIVPEE